MINFNQIDTKDGGYVPAYYDIDEDDVPVAIRPAPVTDNGDELTSYVEEVDTWQNEHPFQILTTQMNTEYLEKLQALQSEIDRKYTPLFERLIENPSVHFDILAYTGESELKDFDGLWYS